SGGEQQRVAIAVALANDPPVILADEPTAELDSVNARNVVNLITKLTKELGKTVILATHDPRVAVKADRILRIEDGRIVGEFKPIDLEKGFTAPEASGTAQVNLAEVVKVRLTMVEEEVAELERRFRAGEISTDEFHERLSRLKRIQEALKELLTSLGSE
ncbi:MAG: ATP-binding cassette domain-containing protein, partial [Desulfurococcales archaeon]|nr:ATP-binding cassette domain-containing protein [Desulfurococcales archaeon]